MSEDSDDNAAPAETPAAKTARKRPSVRKTAKARPAAETDAAPAAEAPAAREAAPAPEPAPERTPSASAGESVSAAGEGVSESHDAGRIAFLVETPAGEPGGNSKKRRRRKKKHGKQPQQQSQHPHAVAPHGEAPATAQPAEQASTPMMHATPRPKLDSDLVARKAWKIFQAEVGEEGLALIDDHDAREISRRCFRLAEIFLEEAARRSR